MGKIAEWTTMVAYPFTPQARIPHEAFMDPCDEDRWISFELEHRGTVSDRWWRWVIQTCVWTPIAPTITNKLPVWSSMPWSADSGIITSEIPTITLFPISDWKAAAPMETRVTGLDQPQKRETRLERMNPNDPDAIYTTHDYTYPPKHTGVRTLTGGELSFFGKLHEHQSKPWVPWWQPHPWATYPEQSVGSADPSIKYPNIIARGSATIVTKYNMQIRTLFTVPLITPYQKKGPMSKENLSSDVGLDKTGGKLHC